MKCRGDLTDLVKFNKSSLSQWSLQDYLLPPAHHGEKFSTTNPNLENTATDSYDSNVAMETQFLEMDMDPAKFICVNPYEVNPVIPERSMPSTTLSVDVQLKDESSVTLQRHWDTSYGGGFYGPQGKIKLEMEEFSDLSSYVLPKPTSTNSVDELNTPIFDKDAFDFNVNVHPKDSQSEDIFVKLESDVIYENTCIITDNNQFKDFSLRTGKVQTNGNINSVVGNIVLPNTDFNVFSPQSENGSAYSCQTSPSLENKNTAVYNVDDNSALSVNRQFFDVPSTSEHYRSFNGGLETPEDSNSNTSHESYKRPSHLSLNIGLKSTAESNLATPSILQEVVDLENANFNILDLVGNEEITCVNPEDIFSSPLTAISATSTKLTAPSAKQKQTIPQKRPRKKRVYTDDDEDYVPPKKRNVVQRKKIILEESDSELDSDVDVDFKPKCKTRGRPPKRTESVSSDGSKDSDASKYRELRDKNNEASRKSRLKRKMKELDLENEASELESKNIKLKAQVEQLEKMVEIFRDNLFKIMMKK